MDKLVTMCGSVDGVYLALIGDGYMGSWLSERHGSWDAQGGRRTKVKGIKARITASHESNGFLLLLLLRVLVTGS